MAMENQQSQRCTYCSRKATTRDHIPPKCLFPNPLPSNLITVPSCQRCNAGASKDDEYFRSRIVCKEQCGGQRSAQKVAAKVMRSFSRPAGIGFAKEFIGSIKDFEVISPGGLFLGMAKGYNVDHERINRVLKRIIAGLHFAETGLKVAQKLEIDVIGVSQPAPPDAEIQVRNWVAKMKSIRTPKTIGDGVFAYTYVETADRKDVTAWAIEFYESDTYLGFCAPPDTRLRR